MTNQIATAAEQQGQVIEEINRNLTGISQLASETSDEVQKTDRQVHDLTDSANRMQTLIRHFNL